MDIYDLLSNPGPADRPPWAAKIRRKWTSWSAASAAASRQSRFMGKSVKIASFPANAPKLAILQGLVWELVIPLNPDHLHDSPFLNYLKQADLLDFPASPTSFRIPARPSNANAGTAKKTTLLRSPPNSPDSAGI